MAQEKSVNVAPNDKFYRRRSGGITQFVAHMGFYREVGWEYASESYKSDADTDYEISAENAKLILRGMGYIITDGPVPEPKPTYPKVPVPTHAIQYSSGRDSTLIEFGSEIQIKNRFDNMSMRRGISIVELFKPTNS